MRLQINLPLCVQEGMIRACSAWPIGLPRGAQMYPPPYSQRSTCMDSNCTVRDTPTQLTGVQIVHVIPPV